MQNIFQLYPEFIDTDIRTLRQSDEISSYNVNAMYQFQRHSVTMLPDNLTGLRVLDLGCCVGATGAWALHHGARRYVGVELQKNFCQLAEDNLTKHFPTHDWDILSQSFSEFFANNKEQFDLVVAFGILYNSIEIESLIRNLSQLDADLIVIDTQSPKRIQGLFKRHQVPTELLDQLAYIELGNGGVLSETGHKIMIESANISPAALKIMFNRYHYGMKEDHTDLMRSIFPLEFNLRYSISFQKNYNIIDDAYTDFETTYNDPSKQTLVDFDSLTLFSIGDHWSFDTGIADSFDQHARQHIPDYDRVIDLCITVCQHLIKDPAEDRILEVGSAVGETVKRLFAKDFHNIVGVESSANMLDKIRNVPIAHWIESDQFPHEHGPYQAVLCNWTLHFIKDKQTYLQKIYDGLNDGGFAIITDKTSNVGTELELYHNFKRTQGVSEEDIVAKAASVQSIMFINEPSWYLDTLKEIGFKQVAIINSAPCFTTFLAQKY